MADFSNSPFNRRGQQGRGPGNVNDGRPPFRNQGRPANVGSLSGNRNQGRPNDVPSLESLGFGYNKRADKQFSNLREAVLRRLNGGRGR